MENILTRYYIPMQPDRKKDAAQIHPSMTQRLVTLDRNTLFVIPCNNPCKPSP